MTDAQQREAARQFYYRWNGKGKEDEHARSYWIELLHDVLGVEDVTQRVEFEKKLIGSKGSTERIDVYIPETRVIIEQKTLGTRHLMNRRKDMTTICPSQSVPGGLSCQTLQKFGFMTWMRRSRSR